MKVIKRTLACIFAMMLVVTTSTVAFAQEIPVAEEFDSMSVEETVTARYAPNYGSAYNSAGSTYGSFSMYLDQPCPANQLTISTSGFPNDATVAVDVKLYGTVIRSVMLTGNQEYKNLALGTLIYQGQTLTVEYDVWEGYAGRIMVWAY